MIKVSNRYNSDGIKAEAFIINHYMPSLGLSLKKIPEASINGPDGPISLPDGYILKDNKEIALCEIKLITPELMNENSEIMQEVKTDNRIRRQVKKAKNQLKTIDTDLPKIVYVVMDDSYGDSEELSIGLFGKFITIMQGNKKIYEGHEDYFVNDNGEKQVINLFSDDFLSGVVFILPTYEERGEELIESFNTILFTNEIVNNFPKTLCDEIHLIEHWSVYIDGNKRKSKLISGKL